MMQYIHWTINRTVIIIIILSLQACGKKEAMPAENSFDSVNLNDYAPSSSKTPKSDYRVTKSKTDLDGLEVD